MTNEIKDFLNGDALTYEAADALLCLKNHSTGYYALLQRANEYARTQFGDKGKVFAQIGLDAQPCEVDCKFCTFAKSSFCGQPQIKTLEETISQAQVLLDAGIDEMFLMTTAGYAQSRFLEIATAVRAIMPTDMPLVANVGDFDEAFAKKLKAAGFTGVYHICRLGEGVDTAAKPQTRINTLNAVRNTGLQLYYCVEPIGPEHTNAELIEEMQRAREYPVGVMAVMKRIAVPGTPLFTRGEITAATLAKICAVATLFVRPQKAMGVHEPDELCLMAGANQIYAECGANPRDTQMETKNGRGFSVANATAMLKKTEWA